MCQINFSLKIRQYAIFFVYYNQNGLHINILHFSDRLSDNRQKILFFVPFMGHLPKMYLQFKNPCAIIIIEQLFGTIVRKMHFNKQKGSYIMEACTYFILAIILFLTSFGALSATAAIATFSVAVIMLCGGLYTKFCCAEKR